MSSCALPKKQMLCNSLLEWRIQLIVHIYDIWHSNCYMKVAHHFDFSSRLMQRIDLYELNSEKKFKEVL